MQEINANAFCIINALGWYRLMATSFSRYQIFEYTGFEKITFSPLTGLPNCP